MFAIIKDGYLFPAPRRLVIGSLQIFNPSDEQYIQMGYKPVSESPMPDVPDGFVAEMIWKESDTEITQLWNLNKSQNEGGNN